MVLTAYDQGSKKSKILISGNYHDNYPLQVYLQLKKNHFCTIDIMKGKKSVFCSFCDNNRHTICR